MEIVFANNKHDNFEENKIIGFYGDVVDLLKMGVDIEGIIYDDEWTVKRFLNGMSIRLNRRIEGILSYIDFDKKYLNVKLKDLSKTNFKYVLLAYLLLKNKKIIIFDYFEVGLTYKEQKKLINIIRMMRKDGLSIIVVSKNLVFLDQFVDSIQVVKNEKIVYNGKIAELIKSEKKLVDEENIIKFIKLANKKGANLDYTLDSKELLKDIYRSVY